MKKHIATILFVVIFGLSGCTDFAVSDTESGWDSFEAKNYPQALSYFQSALDWDMTFADAYNGLGWTYMKLDSMNKAIEAFENGLPNTDSLLDLYAGLAISTSAKHNYSKVVDNIFFVLNKDAEYVFSHDTQINYKLLHAVLAREYVYAEEYDKALSEIQTIDSSFTASPNTQEGKEKITEWLEKYLKNYGV